MINCIVIDDEPLALAQLEQYVNKTPTLNLKASFDNALDALSYLKDNKVELLFVDINMPKLSGLEFVEALSFDVKVVFVTAYREYALEGFAVDAADYLLKPLSYAAFLKSVEKVSQRYFNLAKIDAGDKDFMFVRSEYRSVRVDFEEILYIESKKEYLDIVLLSGKVITTHGSLGAMSKKLPKDKFLRVHRSYTVNLKQVKVIERGCIVFDKLYIPISETAKDVVTQLLG